jgi:hypothetical protein
MSAHLEGVLAELLRQRCHSLRSMVYWEALPPMQFTEGEQKHLCDLKPLYESLLRVVAALEDESHTATLTKLIELYNVVFSPGVRDIVGKELHEDLLALASLRNLFAHGRDFFLEFEDPISIRLFGVATEMAAADDGNLVEQAGPVCGTPLTRRALARARENENPQSRLLEAQHGEWLDTGAASTANVADSDLATVGKIDRATNGGR